MKKTLILFCLLIWTGCAIGRVGPDGSLHGMALGHAKLERSADGSTKIEGGSISNNMSELLGAALAAVGAYFGIGAL